ncbi:MAG TPA: hypothetical protein DCP98_04840 [Sphaerochaeta sp.]|nr:hypothetical protein [Sphaerochaeta sp.]
MADQKPTRPQTRYGIDLIAGCICFAVSIYVMLMSIKFWKEDFVDVFYYSSGLMPMIIGGCLCIFSVLYIVRTLKEHPLKECLTDIKNFGIEFVKSKNVHRSLIGIAIFWVYIFLMLGKMPFWLATFIALSALLLFLNFKKSVWQVVKLLIISACATFAIVLVFQIIFKVPMP